MKKNFNNKLLENFGINKKKIEMMFNFSGLNTRMPINGLRSKHSNEINKNLKRIKTGRKLRENIKTTILFLSKIRSYKGNRHRLKYPVRGQRTHTNAKTNKRIKI